MMRPGLPAQRGFTFVEILAALLFIAILFPALQRALTVSSRASIMAQRSATAVQLAENELDLLLLDSSWSSGAARGDFGEDWKDYRWELARHDWAQDSMSELTMTVFFHVQGLEQSVKLTTLASDTATTGSGTATGTGQ